MNLLKETLNALSTSGKKEKDVLWVGNATHECDWSAFKILADTDYDSGFGAAEVAQDLLIVGQDWWLERHEYDGSEWWEYKETPKKPQEKILLKALTVEQAEAEGFKVSCGWESLLTLNGLAE